MQSSLKDVQSIQANYKLQAFKKGKLPNTDCVINTKGNKFIVGSYDCEAKIFQTNNCKILRRLRGHKNVVLFRQLLFYNIKTKSYHLILFNNIFNSFYNLKIQINFLFLLDFCISLKYIKVTLNKFRLSRKTILNNNNFNLIQIHLSRYCMQQSNKVVTGSFDKLSMIWDVETGKCQQKLDKHNAEVVCSKFDPTSKFVATASMDQTAKLWNVETGQLVHDLVDHTQEVISINFNNDGQLLLSGSFDYTANLYDTKTGKLIKTYKNHQGELSKAIFDTTGTLIATSSIDKTCCIWDIRTEKYLKILNNHSDEILDCNFSDDEISTFKTQLFQYYLSKFYNKKSQNIRFSSVTSSSDCTAIVYDVMTFNILGTLDQQEGDVVRALFDPQGQKVITASQDKSAQIYSINGQCLQKLHYHQGEIAELARSNDGKTIITVDLENQTAVWRQQ